LRSPQVVLADLGRPVALRREQVAQRRILRLDPLRRARHPHRRQPGAHWDLPRDQRGAPGRAARLRIAVGQPDLSAAIRSMLGVGLAITPWW
jgi:hypothetical protein